MFIDLKIITWLCQERLNEVLHYNFLLFRGHFVKVVGKHLHSENEENTKSVTTRNWICNLSDALLTYICWYEWQLRFLRLRQVRNWADACGRSLLRRLENHLVMTLWFLSCSSVSRLSLISLITSRTSVADGTTMLIDCWWNQVEVSLWREFTWAFQRAEMRLTMLAKMSKAGSKTILDLVSNIFQSILEWLLFPGRLHFRSDANCWAVKFACRWENHTTWGFCIVSRLWF